MLEMVKISERLTTTDHLELDYEQFTDDEVKYIVDAITPYIKTTRTDLTDREYCEYTIRHKDCRKFTIESLSDWWESEVKYENNRVSYIIKVNHPTKYLGEDALGRFKTFEVHPHETTRIHPKIEIIKRSDLVVGSKIEKDPWNRDKITAIRQTTEERVL